MPQPSPLAGSSMLAGVSLLADSWKEDPTSASNSFVGRSFEGREELERALEEARDRENSLRPRGRTRRIHRDFTGTDVFGRSYGIEMCFR